MGISFSNSRSNAVKQLVLYPEKCTGCMSCVLACSLHNGERFDRRISSIKVSISKKEREIEISIVKGKARGLQACDDCEGEKEPLCVKYCTPKAIDYR
jgi:Fe-S-cluster-containing dehydrogenase component